VSCRAKDTEKEEIDRQRNLPNTTFIKFQRENETQEFIYVISFVISIPKHVFNRIRLP
jgi:hypothetical protein